jgi:hypothetical protein
VAHVAFDGGDRYAREPSQIAYEKACSRGRPSQPSTARVRMTVTSSERHGCTCWASKEHPSHTTSSRLGKRGSPRATVMSMDSLLRARRSLVMEIDTEIVRCPSAMTEDWLGHPGMPVLVYGNRDGTLSCRETVLCTVMPWARGNSGSQSRVVAKARGPAAPARCVTAASTRSSRGYGPGRLLGSSRKRHSQIFNRVARSSPISGFLSSPAHIPSSGVSAGRHARCFPYLASNAFDLSRGRCTHASSTGLQDEHVGLRRISSRAHRRLLPLNPAHLFSSAYL